MNDDYKLFGKFGSGYERKLSPEQRVAHAIAERRRKTRGRKK